MAASDLVAGQNDIKQEVYVESDNTDICSEVPLQFHTIKDEGYLKNYKIPSDLHSYNCNICEDVFQSEDELTRHNHEWHLDNENTKVIAKIEMIQTIPNQIKSETNISTDTINEIGPLDQVTCNTEMMKTSSNQTKSETNNSIDTIDGNESFLDENPINEVSTFTDERDKFIQMDKKANEKSYSCTVADCQKQYYSKRGLELHLKTHVDERKPTNGKHHSTLQGCDKLFTQCCRLSKHTRVQHESTEFKCEFSFCCYKFGSSLAHDKHMQKGINKSCISSNLSKSKLKVHKKDNAGLLPFKCKFSGCEKAFETIYEFTAHKNDIHCGKKPFACKYRGCDKSFNSNCDFRIHMKRCKMRVFK